MHVLYWIALSLWISTIVTGAIAASVTFSTLPNMPITIDGYVVDDRINHGSLTAGIAMEKVFFICDMLQYVMSAVVLIALLFQWMRAVGRAFRFANITRTICLVAAAATLAYHGFVLAPVMNPELRAYWAAIEVDEAQGKTPDIDAALAHRAEFQTGHHLAEYLMEIRLILLLIAIGCSAVAMGPVTRTTQRNGVEEPALLKRKT